MAENVEIEITLVERQATDSLNKLGTATKRFEGVAKASFDKISQAWDYFVGNIAANVVSNAFNELTASVSQATKEFFDFSRAVTQINSILPESAKLTDNQKIKMAELAREFGSDVVTQAETYFQIMTEGFNDSAVTLDILTQANKLSAVAMISTKEAASALTDIMDVYVKRGETATTVSDKLVAATRKSEKSFGEFTGALGQLAPIADSLGIGLNDLSTTLSFLTANGVKTESAVGGLRQIMNAFLDPSKEAKKAASDLGIEMNTQAIRSKGLSNTLIDLIGKTDGSAESLKGMFGSFRELAPILAISQANMVDFKQSLEDITNSAGLTDKAFNEVSKSMSFQMNVLKGNLKNLSVQFIMSMEEPLTNALVAVNGFINGLTDMSAVVLSIKKFIVEYEEDMKALGVALGVVSVAVAGYLVYLNAVPIALAVYSAAMWTATAAQGAFNAVMAATPWGLVAIGIAGVSFGIYELVKNFETVMYWFQSFQNFLADKMITTFQNLISIAVVAGDYFGMKIPEHIREALASLEEMKAVSEEEQKLTTEQYEERMRQKEAEKQASISKLEEEYNAKVSTSQKEAALESKKLEDKYKNALKENTVKATIQKEELKTKNEIWTAEELLAGQHSQNMQRFFDEISLQEKLAGNESYEYLRKNLGDIAAMNAVFEANELEAAGKHKEALERLEKAHNDAMLQEKRKAQLDFQGSAKGYYSAMLGYKRNADSGEIESSEKTYGEKMDMAKQSFSAMSSLMSSSNSTLFRMGQAAALANGIVSIAEGILKALSFGPILGPIFASMIGTAGAVQLGVIASQKPPAKMESGGIVPGMSYSGDNVLIRANSSEMVLNRRQQANLFNMANQGMSADRVGTNNTEILALTEALNNQPIIIEIDGIQIAKATRRAIESGFVLQGV